MQYAVNTAITALKDYKVTVDEEIAEAEASLEPKDTTEAKLKELHKFHEMYLNEREVFVTLQDGDDTSIRNSESLDKLCTAVTSLKRTADSLIYSRHTTNPNGWNTRQITSHLRSLKGKAKHVQSVITALEGAQEENISTAELDRLGFFKIIRF